MFFEWSAVIGGADFSVGTCKVLRLDDGRLVRHIDAMGTKTGETWSVEPPSEWAAVWVPEEQVRIDLAGG